MTSSVRPRGVRSVGARWIAPMIGAVVGILVVSLLLQPVASVPRTIAPVSTPPAEVDPQFLPDILTSSSPASSGFFGQSIAVHGSTAVIGAPGEEQYVDGYEDEGLVHVRNLSTGATELLGATFTGQEGDFGWSVAVDAGYIAVGAPGEDYSANNAYMIGHVFVFNATTFAQIDAFESPNAVEWYSDSVDHYYSDDFGASVALSGSTLVVGAPGENASSVQGAGHAYVINLKTNAMTMLASPEPQPLGGFGKSVSINGNYIAVGAPFEGLLGFGNAYLFSASTGDLIQAYTDGGASEGTEYGLSVAVDWPYLAIGAPGQTDAHPCPSGLGAGQCGAVFLYNLQNGTETTLTDPAPTGADDFGSSVALDANLVLVGAPASSPDSSSDTGAAYLFTAPNGQYVNSGFAAPEWPAAAEFGQSVALNATTAFVGAPYERAEDYADAGQAFAFLKIPLAYSSPVGAVGDGYASALSINGGALAIGSPNDTVGSHAGAGRVFYEHSIPGPIQAFQGTAADEHFGAAVLVTSTVLYVGAPGAPGYDGGTGAVVEFNATTGAEVDTLLSPVGNVQSFGSSLAIVGTTLMVGAPASGAVEWIDVATGSLLGALQALTDGSETGASVAIDASVWVIGAPGFPGIYVGASGDYNTFMFLSDPTGSSTGQFGLSVAAGGSTYVVGAPGDAGGGQAFVYSGPSAETPEFTLNDPNATTGGGFGTAVADNGGTIVVGAPGENPYGVAGAGNIVLYSASTGTVSDRYNGLGPVASAGFGSAVALGSGGDILVGNDFPGQNTTAFLFFL